MNLSRPDADIYAPDGTPPDQALARTTHLCVAAHQDDIEIMAQAGIDECHGAADRFFTGVVMTNGAGSPRTGPGTRTGATRKCRRCGARSSGGRPRSAATICSSSWPIRART